MGPSEVSYSAFSVNLLHRGVGVGVVYTEITYTRKLKRSHDGFKQCVDGAITENFADNSDHPVPYLQVVSPEHTKDTQ